MKTNKTSVSHLVLTLDYELYGDGSGSVFDTMIHPTANFLSVCKKHGIKATIFFEVMEYLRMEEEWASGNRMGYEENPVEAIEKQIQQAHLEGHDIQLHIHPHWINARYSDGRWHPDHRYWKLTKVPLTADQDFPIGLEELIARGKAGIESVVRTVDPGYDCNIFRAGGFSLTPSDEIVKVLLKLGFIADSSVIPGAFIENEYYSYDFRHLSLDTPFWMVDRAVERPADTTKGLIEIPIFSKSITRYKKYDGQRIRIALKNKSSNMVKIKDKVEGRSSLWSKIGFFLEKEHLTWDFCLFSRGKMQQYLRYARSFSRKQPESFYPFVLIGHSKEFIYSNTFERFVEANRKNLQFLTLKDTVYKIQQSYRTANNKISKNGII
ncbi:hypothetical protein SAMN04488057_105310 [Cyclobacterium lianum]|uniref:Polysaccharide deacetylase n=1 Tax=Cyclobacterium lianum TaxID=388280 RepID=A0A1M7NGT8_9BACT|nr:hypothetical protein [Cyclobacterium lianum]SHN02885.1 hypothetical protein SAMN04488057_105310 [Cyclobacterium lianum]